MEQKQTLMAGSEKNAHSQRQQDANDFVRRIKESVNKQVEKRIAELRAEFQLMNLELRQQLEAKLKKYLGEPEMKAAGATPQHVTTQDQECTVVRQLEEEEHYNSDREDDKEQILNQILSAGPFETPNCSEDGFDSSKLSDGEIRPLSAEHHSTSHQTQCGPINNQTSPSDARSVSQCTNVDEKEIEEAVLMKEQWTKWLDEMEGKIICGKRKPQVKKKSEKQENIAKHARAEEPMSKTRHPNIMTKIRKNVSRFFQPSYKWEKLD